MSAAPRKKTFVDPQVQGALVRRLIMHWAGFFALASLVAFILQVLSNPFEPISVHLQQLWWTQGPFLLATVFLLPVFVLDTIKLSHRFVGPIKRLQSTIRNISTGEGSTTVKFREVDFWQGLAEEFNEMVEKIGLKSASQVQGNEEVDPAAQTAIS